MTQRRFGPYTVETSNEEKVYFPGSGPTSKPGADLTKGDLIAYYEAIADRILPHLRQRPVMVQRFPDGIEDEGFYQKQAGSHFPDWIHRCSVEVTSTGERQDIAVCDNRATLVYLVDQGCITFHPWLSRVDRLDHPDSLIVDLDPPEDDFESARRAALRVRSLFAELELPCYAKLTGSQGIHLLVPLDRSADFDRVRGFARDAMELLASRHPEDLTTEQRKAKRRGRLYLDVGRNAYAQTAVAPWSVRPLPDAPVAAPVPWSALERPGLGPRDFRIGNVFQRISGRRDPWSAARRRSRSLPRAIEALERLRDEAG